MQTRRVGGSFLFTLSALAFCGVFGGAPVLAQTGTNGGEPVDDHATQNAGGEADEDGAAGDVESEPASAREGVNAAADTTTANGTTANPTTAEAPESEEATPEPNEGAQIQLSFTSIRLYTGSELRMAPAATPDVYGEVCELPCRTQIEPGTYNLRVVRDDGRIYALPQSMDFQTDGRVSLKYGVSRGVWAGGITAVTGLVGVLLGGGFAISGAANDDSGRTLGGMVAFSLSTAVFITGLVIFLMSERGLRAQLRAPDAQ